MLISFIYRVLYHPKEVVGFLNPLELIDFTPQELGRLNKLELEEASFPV